MLVQRQLSLNVSHYEIGDYIEYGWFRGEVVGLSIQQLQHSVRVCEVIRPGPGKSVGSIQRVSFNLGTLVERPERRNHGS